MSLDVARRAEHAKYVRAYAGARYGMGPKRKSDAVMDLRRLPARGSYLDVSCGRGEMLAEAGRMGFSPLQGTEIVPSLIDGKRVVRAEVHALPFPDSSFDVVTMFDVIEHLIPGDDELACRELARVARKHVLIAANNRDSVLRPQWGGRNEQLHINRRSYEAWDVLMHQWFAPNRVVLLTGKERLDFSRTWQVDIDAGAD